MLGLTTVLIALTTVDEPAELIAEDRANQWLAGLAFGLVGALVLRAQPDNRLGKVMAGSGILASVGSTAVEYATLATDRDVSLPGSTLAVVVAATSWFPAFLLVLAALPLLFPDGRLASRRWRLPAMVALVAGVVATFGIATTQAIVDDGGYSQVHNPLDLPFGDDRQLAVVLVCFAVVAVVGAAASLRIVWRLRGVDRDRRQQSAWFVAAVLLGGFGSLLPAPDLVQFALSAASVACLAFGVVHHGFSRSTSRSRVPSSTRC